MSVALERKATRAVIRDMRQAERQAIVREAVRRCGSQAKTAELLVRETRQVERWLAKTFPSPIPVKVIERIWQEWPELRRDHGGA